MSPKRKQILASLHGIPTAEILTANILPAIERVWQQAFDLSEEDLAQRRPKLLALAKEIERFFGPDSRPRTRAEILNE